MTAAGNNGGSPGAAGTGLAERLGRDGGSLAGGEAGGQTGLQHAEPGSGGCTPTPQSSPRETHRPEGTPRETLGPGRERGGPRAPAGGGAGASAPGRGGKEKGGNCRCLNPQGLHPVDGSRRRCVLNMKCLPLRPVNVRP